VSSSSVRIDRTVENRKSILAAVSIPAKGFTEAVLKDKYETSFVVDIGTAKTLVAQKKYDLVICNAHFSESHSLELLQYVKASKVNSDTPFLLIRALDSPFNKALNKSVEMAARELGADHYIDVAELGKKIKGETLVDHVHKVLEDLLDKSSEPEKTGQIRVSSDWNKLGDGTT
jgi:PleD family two-component response regulator